MAHVDRQWRHTVTGIFTTQSEIPAEFDWEEVVFDAIKGKYNVILEAVPTPEVEDLLDDVEHYDEAEKSDGSEFQQHPPTGQPMPPKVNRIPEYVPPKIKGYRQLSALELELTNAVKEHAEATRHLIASIEAASDSEDYPGFDMDRRWLSIAKTDLQKGYMFLVRSITKPTSF